MAPALDRFREAQEDPASGFACALTELKTTGKRSHWIWYVFPQLSGLGNSRASQIYAIANIREAELFLQDPSLRNRLLTASTVVAQRLRQKVSLENLMGSSIDALKLVSSLTLFGSVARRLGIAGESEEYRSLAALADEILAAAAGDGYPACRYTMERLTARGRTSR